MKIHRYLSAVVVAGSAGLCLMSSGATAQVQTPRVDDVQKDVQKNVRGNTDTGNNAGVDSNSEIRSRARVDGDADIRNDARARGSADIDSDTGLGFRFDDDPDSLTISTVSENGLAARAGLRQGDRIVSVNGRRFSSNTDVNAYLATQAGARIPLTFIRDGQQRSVMITPRRVAAFREGREWRGGRPTMLGTTFAGDSGGLVVSEVLENSPAYQAGLRAGDEIVCFNGWSYRDADQFAWYLDRFPRGRALPITYRRDGRLYSTRVTLTDPNAEGFVRSRDGRTDRLPPAPGAEDFGQDGELAEGNYEGRRRSAMRPNFDQMSREQLQREVEQLRRENDNLRRDLDSIRGEPGTDRPQSRIDAETDLNGNQNLDVESETELNNGKEIEDGNRIESDTEVETERSKTDVESETRLPKPAPAQKRIDTPLGR